MRWITTLQQRYVRWLFRRTLERFVTEGLWDTHPGLIVVLLDGLKAELPFERPELDVPTRRGRYYETSMPTIDSLFVYIMDATRTFLDAAFVSTTPILEVQPRRLEEFLEDNYGRPLPVAMVLSQTLRSMEPFIDALQGVADPRQRTYYLRKYDWLLEESQRWLVYALYELSNP